MSWCSGNMVTGSGTRARPASITLALIAVILLSSQAKAEARYAIEIHLVCDKACSEILRARADDPAGFLYDLAKETDQRLSSIETSLVVTGLEVWNGTDVIGGPEASLEDIRMAFAKYRSDVQLRRRWSDVSMLVTGRSVSAGDNHNGLMPLGGACTTDYGAGIVRLTIQDERSLAATVAHELGHGLGMIHDVSGCCDAGDNNCLMATAINSQQIMSSVFSRCSKGDFNAFLDRPKSDCLRNTPATAMTPSSRDTCGNGVVDPGEECDCGKGCLGGCCNCCQGCRLRSPSHQCFQGACCDTDTCQFLSQGHPCREGSSSCDLADFCTGHTSQCPDNQEEDGIACQGHGLETGFCRQGRCLTRADQCADAWGYNYTTGAVACHTITLTRPSLYGHCGMSAQGAYQPCSMSDTNHYKCGLLQCTGPADTSSLSPYKNPRRNIFVSSDFCLSGRHGDWESEEGPLYVADGTECDTNNVCLGGDCVDKTIFFGQEEEPIVTASFCGDGKIEGSETCDCGPYQCDCCHPETCQLRSRFEPCEHDRCRRCDGRSPQCSPTRKVANFEPCDDGRGQCFRGGCSSLDRACQRMFGSNAVSADRAIYATHRYDNSSQNNGGGFLLRDVTSAQWSSRRAFLPSGGDNGLCGVLLCVTGENAVIPDDSGRPLPTVTFYTNYDNNIRVGYFSLETVRDGPSVYQRYYPALVDRGSPCTIEGQRGYCATNRLRLDEVRKHWFWAAKCIPV